MKDYLKYIPGFGSNTKWKKIVASIFYVLHILMSLIVGLDYFLIIGGIALFIFTLVKLGVSIKNKKSLKRPALLFIVAIFIFSSGINVSEKDDLEIKEAEQVKLAEEKNLEEQVEKAEKERIELEEAQKSEEERIEAFAKNFVSAKVTKHVDGDTVHVTLDDGQVLKVRMIGVDTPETVHPSKPVEFYGKEASNFTKEKIFGKTIYLEKDVSDTDKYDRALRYIWMEIPEEISKEEIKNKMFNGMLVAQGFANSSTYQPDVKYQDYFLELERDARDQNVGLWDANKSKEFEVANAEKNNSNKSSTNNITSSSSSDSNSSTTPAKPKVEESAPVTDNVQEVYITNTGSKYHRAGCRYLKSSTPISKSKAQSQGYEACKVCKP